MKTQEWIRQSFAASAVLTAVVFLMPLTVVVPFRPVLIQWETPADETAAPAVGEEAEASSVLRLLKDGQAEELELEEYLTGVVRAEMPASFPQEALKAQAVAARTYTVYKLQFGGKHGETADVCADAACCQAYMSETEAAEKWGEDAEGYEKKVREAVSSTKGEIILYNNVPILAVFHAASSGMTRAAGTVWQDDLPYLQAVASPEAAETVPDYCSRAEFTAKEFRTRVRAVYPKAKLTGAVDGWLNRAVTDSAGNVETVEVGGVELKGSQLRALLGLRSACFTWSAENGNLVFYVTGYGHGVGLSQYGAGKMAEEGADYREILTHYYTGVSVERYTPVHGTVPEEKGQ